MGFNSGFKGLITLYGNMILTASILSIYVTQQDTNVKLPDDDIEMSKHVRIYIYIYIYIYLYIKRYCCDI